MTSYPARIHYLAILSFAIIGICIYSNTLHSPFYFDDFNNIQNSSLKMEQFSLDTLKNAVSQGRLEKRLVANITFALNYFVHKYSLPGYHITNIAIHICNAIVLYFFILMTLRLPANQKKYKHPALMAYVTALLWLVHPLGTQSVTYLVQRMNSLAFLFYLLSLICYIQARVKQKNSVEGKAVSVFWNYFLSIVFGLLALGSKEIAATLPIMILLYEMYFFREFRFRRTKFLIFWGILTLSTIIGIMYFYLGDNPWRIFSGTCSIRDFTVSERLLTELRVVMHYISLILYPHPDRLVFDYNFPLSTTLFKPIFTFYSLLALTGLLILSIIIAKKEKLLSFCILGFFVTLVIESSIICLELIYEHRTYLPSIFLILFCTALLYKITRASRTALICLIILALPLSLWTYQRNLIWNDPLVFWADSVEKAPGKPRSLNNLGNAYYYKGKYKEAVSSYKKVLDIKPDYLPTLKNIAIAYRALENYEKAEEYCRLAIQYAPDFIDVYNNLGAILALQNKTQEAEKYYKKALELAPHHPLVNKNLGSLLLRQGKVDEALQFLEKAELYNKFDTKLLLNLGEAYLRTGKIEKALATYRRVLDLDNNSDAAHYNIALIQAAKGNEKEALKHYRKTVELNPFYIPARYNYGNLLLRDGKDEKALEQYQKIIEMRPEMADAYNNLGLIMIRKNDLEAAKYYFRQALQIMPDHEMAQRNLELLQQK